MPKINQPKKVVRKVHLDPELVEWLEEHSIRQGCSVSQTIRTLILNLRSSVKGDSK